MHETRVLDNDEICQSVGRVCKAADRLSPNVLSFCSRINAEEPVSLPFTDVNPEPNKHNWCVQNVDAYVGRHGGGRSLGWIIGRSRHGSSYLAMFHCVWLSPEGELVDITQRPGHDPITAFLPDPARTAIFTGTHIWTSIFMDQARGVMLYEQVDGSIGPTKGPFEIPLKITREKLPSRARLK